MDTKQLGLNIRKYRKKAGLSQNEAAEKIGLSPNYLRQIELGNKVPRLSTFIKIAEVLHVSADSLLLGIVSWSLDIQGGELQEMIRLLNPAQKKLVLEVVQAIIHNITVN